MSTALLPVGDVHLHECKDREDDICIPRGYCECECGAWRTFPIPTFQPAAEWNLRDAGSGGGTSNNYAPSKPRRPIGPTGREDSPRVGAVSE